jgi:hypothetical protein
MRFNENIWSYYLKLWYNYTRFKDTIKVYVHILDKVWSIVQGWNLKLHFKGKFLE